MRTLITLLLLAVLARGAQAAVATGDVFTFDPKTQTYVATADVILGDRTLKIRTRIGHTPGGDALTYDLLTRTTGLPERKNTIQVFLRWSLTSTEYAALGQTMPSAEPVRGRNDVIADAEFDAIQGSDIKELHPARPVP